MYTMRRLLTLAAFCTPSQLPYQRKCGSSRIISGSCTIMEMKQDNSDTTNFSESVSASSGMNGSVNGAAVSGGLVAASDAKSQLFSAFTALDLPDQYDAVLTGLCAKILDNEQSVQVQSGEATVKALQDPIQLLQEMNQKRIIASPRSIMALIDSTVKAQDAQVMAQVLSLCMRNGGIQYYGSLQADVQPLPSAPSSRIKCPDGSTKTRAERLALVSDIPVDDRVQEVTSALAVSAVAAGCTLTDVMHVDDLTLYANTLLTAMLAVGVVDNFYDLIKSGSSLAASQMKKNSGNIKSDGSAFQLPEKDSLPLGLGTGKVSGSVFRGLTRLLTVDAERECDCEAAGLFAAYMLGLPCFSFRPNALEASILVVESTKDGNNSGVSPLLSSAGIMRVLVWLMAPVAMESMKHAQLIVSDPREAEGVLLRLEDYAKNTNPALAKDLWWTDDAQERADLLKWAYTEADLLLRDNKMVVQEIAQRLTGGAATIGDCVAVMERW